MTPRWLLALLAGALLAGWAIGLLVFLANIEAPPPASPPLADGVVALTGGAGRVEAALHLLAEGDVRQLLVSGAGPGVELAEIAHRAGLDPARLARGARIGHDATTTRGNATETATWAREEKLRSVIVVTSYWHMPRALVELRRAAPGVTFLPDPVGAEPGHPVPWRLLSAEYTKWLIAWLGLSRLELDRPKPEPTHNEPTHSNAPASAPGSHPG